MKSVTSEHMVVVVPNQPKTETSFTHSLESQPCLIQYKWAFALFGLFAKTVTLVML